METVKVYPGGVQEAMGVLREVVRGCELALDAGCAFVDVALALAKTEVLPAAELRWRYAHPRGAIEVRLPEGAWGPLGAAPLPLLLRAAPHLPELARLAERARAEALANLPRLATTLGREVAWFATPLTARICRLAADGPEGDEARAHEGGHGACGRHRLTRDRATGVLVAKPAAWDESAPPGDMLVAAGNALYARLRTFSADEVAEVHPRHCTLVPLGVCQEPDGEWRYYAVVNHP